MRSTDLARHYGHIRLIFGGTTDPKSAALRASTICSVPAALVLLASIHDRTLFLDPGTGLLQHAGYWGYVLSAPLLTFLTWMLLHRINTLTENLIRFAPSGDLPHDLRVMVHAQMRQFRRKSWMWQLWLFFSMCGMFYTLLNMRWVMEPVRFYGTPTFDSLDHTLVFVANRLFMAFMTIYVFPTSLIVCIGATVLIRRVLNYMARTDQITINLFDSDNCGGLSEFGLINALIMGIYFILLTNIVLNMQSHRSQTWMLVLPLIGMSIVIALQSVLAVYSIHGCVQAKKQEALTNVSRRLSNQLIDLEKSGYFPSDLLALRDHLLSVRTYPYSTYINGVVNLLRLSPALLGVARLVFR